MRISRSISLEHLGEYLKIAKERLSTEKQEILKRHPLPKGYNREEYVFAYRRAERMGMLAIHAHLAEIAWLPMQLDPKSELLDNNRTAMKRWLTATSDADPTAEDFGNDFIHALTRTAICLGADDPACKKLAQRIGTLFRNLSCLIGMIYYSTWLAEHDIGGVSLTDPEDLHRSVVELAAIVQSPDLHQALKQRAEEVRKAKEKKALESPAVKARPKLQLIHNEHDKDHGYMPDTLPV